VAGLQKAAAEVLNRYANFAYFFGVSGLQNYGILNDPSLSASLTPGAKANGNGNVWIISGGAINATANEVFADIQALFYALVAQSGGVITIEDKMKLVISPNSAVALTITNSFGVNVEDLLKKNFPNLKVETAVQYGARSAQNQEGLAAGNFAQLIAESVAGEETGFCAFTEKLRNHKLVAETSSWKQKVSGGVWGAIIQKPFAIASMIGI
jgi:hypothetical protein